LFMSEDEDGEDVGVLQRSCLTKMGLVIAVVCHALDFVQNFENFFEISLVEMRFLISFVTGRDLKIACRG